VNYCPFIRVVISRIPCFGFKNVIVMVEEDADFPIPFVIISQDYLLDVDIFPVIYKVVALKAYAEEIMRGGYIGKKCFRNIIQLKIPIPVYPREVIACPYAQPEFMSVRVVFFAHAWIINTPDAIVAVKCNKEISVSYRYIARHKTLY